MLWSLTTKVIGVSGAGIVMLCVFWQVVHCMSVGSNESDMFWRMLLLLSVRDAKKVLLMPASVSKLPICGAVVSCVVLLSML